MFSVAVLLSLLAHTSAFTVNSSSRQTTALNVRSKSVPFLDQPAALTGKLPGDVGFDPLGITGFWNDVNI